MVWLVGFWVPVHEIIISRKVLRQQKIPKFSSRVAPWYFLKELKFSPRVAPWYFLKELKFSSRVAPWYFLKELNEIYKVNLNILPKLRLVFCCHQQKIQKIYHLWHFNGNNSGSKHFLIWTLSLSVGRFHFWISWIDFTFAFRW